MENKSDGSEINIKEMFETLPLESKKLLISMTHYDQNIGGDKESIIKTSGLKKQEFDKAAEELKRIGLIQQGIVDTQKGIYGTHHTFKENDTSGKIYRLMDGVRTVVLRDILEIPEDEIEL